MPYDYSEIVDAIKKHFTKAVYATTPSKSNTTIPSWKKYKGQNLSSEKGNRTRIFDVEESESGGEVIFTGNGSDDYNVIVNVEVCYENNNRFNTVAMGDYSKIRYKLQNTDNTEILAKGFNFLQVLPHELDEVNEDEEFRFLTIPVLCRITVDNIATIPFEGVYKDLIGDSDVYKDSIGNLEIYKDVI